MSTIDRASRARVRTSRGRESFAARALRMRNACVRHAAARLGLALPTDEDLRALGGDVGLRGAVEWWQDNAPGAVAEKADPRRGRLVLKAGLAMAVTVLGLALSYGRAQ